MIGNKLGHNRSAILLKGAASLFILASLLLIVRVGSLTDLFFTHDQQAQRLFDQGRYKEAAALFGDPMRQGAALYRGGDYKSASQAFARIDTPESRFNRGNALLMLGKYEDAVKAYDRALELKPDWKKAEDNREIARVRGERTKDKGGDMTGGKLGADEIVVETGKGKSQSGQTEVTSGGDKMSDQEIQALWLRRVETKPADFLRTKFAFQLSHEESDTETSDKK